MVGEIVAHPRFGSGRVTGFEPPRIEVAFEGGMVKTFAYPQAVGRFLNFEGEAARLQSERDRDRAEADARELAAARLLADRQRAEAAARQRLEQLHDKRVAAARRTAARSAAARRAKTEAGGETK